MKWHEVEPDVFYAESGPVAVTAADLEFVTAKAKVSRRRRARLCAHPSADDGLHEMIIGLARNGYVRPHRHQKPESALFIQGAGDLVFFDEQGQVTDVKQLGEPNSGKTFFVRLSEPIYHTYLIYSEVLLFAETTPGPLDRTRSQFAPWAPAESEEWSSFQQDLQQRVSAWKR